MEPGYLENRLFQVALTLQDNHCSPLQQVKTFFHSLHIKLINIPSVHWFCHCLPPTEQISCRNDGCFCYTVMHKLFGKPKHRILKTDWRLGTRTVVFRKAKVVAIQVKVYV